MKKRRMHIGWLWSSVLLMMLTGCSSSDGTEERQPTMLTVYVYSPERPMLIRAAVGPVSPTEVESKVNQIQVWLFESASGKKVGYLATDDTSLLNAGEGAAYQIVVDDDFAADKPDVDVYVLANVKSANCGCSFDENSTRDELRNNARLTSDYFGLSRLTTEVPADGLPMAGLLRDQPVVGDAPVLRIGTSTNIATVQLTRAVSKLRFVFANTESAPDLVITGIELDEGMIPDEEYLIPQSRTLSYNSEEAVLTSSGWFENVEAIENPSIYIYDGREAQEYETLIDNSDLTKVGPFYLHESDKRLKGKIYYELGGEAKEGAFEMAAAGDFLRNHTWIVYAYHSGGGFLEIETLYIKEWTTKTVEHGVYNW